MMSLDQIAADVSQNWALYVSMPFVAATIGYVTKIVAIWMMCWRALKTDQGGADDFLDYLKG